VRGPGILLTIIKLFTVKHLLTLTAAFLIASSVFAFSSISRDQRNAANVYIPVGTTGKQISLLDLSTINVKNFENLTGRHLGFLDRIGFKIAQKKLRKSISPDGTINSKKLNKFLYNGDHSTGFHLGGFALGFFVGLIGVLIAYLINDDYKRNRVKWAWIGFGVYVVLVVALLVVLLNHTGMYTY